MAAALLLAPVAAPCSRLPAAAAAARRRRAGGGVRCAATAPAPMGEKTEYRDGPVERAFMGLFARKMEKYAVVSGSGGKEKEKKKSSRSRAVWDWDYESFVDVSRRVMVGRTRAQQQEAVREVLLSMLPPGAPEQFKKLFPPTRWACEFNAALTVPFFHWLVGPSEVVEVEVNGVKQKSGVLIKKCRYLENSGCVGMCVNMCKIPTQNFFTNEFGLPLTMNPNFEDMSCEMIYGQVPPPLEEDPASKQPCYPKLCEFHVNTLNASLSQTSDLEEHIASMLSSDVERFQFLVKTLAPQLTAVRPIDRSYVKLLCQYM
uniref:Beta-carotene isomerase D27-like C-terminal domain-containing protein n=1 Tax=Oryza punctata TaxID=4537 RepID=A0A0E0LQK1_ORYPU